MHSNILRAAFRRPVALNACAIGLTLGALAFIAWTVMDHASRLTPSATKSIIWWAGVGMQILIFSVAVWFVRFGFALRDQLRGEVREFADVIQAVVNGQKKRRVKDAGKGLVGETATALNHLIEVHVQTQKELKVKQESLGLKVQARTVELWRAQRSLLDESERRQKAEQDLQQVQKMEALGKFAGSIAHDFNNLLTVILGGLECAYQKLEGDHATIGILRTVEQAAERGAALTKPLLAFSRNHLHVTEPIQLNEAVEETANMAKRLLGENVQMRIELDPDLRLVEGNTNQLQQILMNLMVNARDAMEGRGLLTISTANVAVDPERLHTHNASSEDGWIALFVSDTGCGMDEETKRKIFEPFFTTKPVGKGTGLGLSTVFGIVKQSKGFVEVESTVGEGTTFQVFLPATRKAKAAPAAPVPATARVEPSKGQEKILLVDDEDDIREFGKLILETFGYEVLTAASAAEGLVLAEQHAASLSLLLTDVTMPGMNGVQLAEALLKRMPRLKVLFVSGHSDEVILADSLKKSAVSFLQKPYRSDILAAKVRDAIAGVHAKPAVEEMAA